MTEALRVNPAKGPERQNEGREGWKPASPDTIQRVLKGMGVVLALTAELIGYARLAPEEFQNNVPDALRPGVFDPNKENAATIVAQRILEDGRVAIKIEHEVPRRMTKNVTSPKQISMEFDRYCVECNFKQKAKQEKSVKPPFNPFDSRSGN